MTKNDEPGTSFELPSDFGFPRRKPTPPIPPTDSSKFDEIIYLLRKLVSHTHPEQDLYYDREVTVTTAQTTALEVNDANYLREQIFEHLRRNASILNVYNRGPGTLYIRSSQDGEIYTDELAVYDGERKTYTDIYELRIRGDTEGGSYRVSERDIWQQTVVTKAEAIEIASTDKDVHFTGAITTNNQETENLTGLNQNKYMIRGVNIQSIQALRFRLIFWYRDTFQNTDLDIDTYIDDVELDMTIAPAFRIGGVNQYYLNVGDLEIIYEDLDATRELHISLQNLSAAAKNAGATGEVQLDIKMTPRV